MKRALVTLLLVAGLLVCGEQAAMAGAPVDGEQAKKLFLEGKHVEAALAYEELYTTRGEARFLFNAGMARELSGHELQAFVHLQRYLRISGLTSDELRDAQERLRLLKERTKHVRISISPTLAAEALTLRFERATDGSSSDRGRAPVTLDGATMAAIAGPDGDGMFDLYLEPGRWEAEVVADGYEAKVFSITADASKRTAEVFLRLTAAGAPRTISVTTTFEPSSAISAGIDVSLFGPTPMQARVGAPTELWELQPGDYTLDAKAPRFKPKRLSFSAFEGMSPIRVSLTPERRYDMIALGAAAGAVFVTGVAISAVYGRELKDTIADFTADAAAGSARAAAAHRNDLMRNSGNRVAGMTLVGAGLGLGLGALTSALEHRVRRPDHLYMGEAIAGVGLTAITMGLTWALPRRDFKNSLDTHYCSNSDIRQADSGYCSPERISGLDLNNPTGPFASVRRADAGALFGGLGIGLLTAGVANLIKLAVHKSGASGKVSVASLQGGVRVSF